MTGSIEEIHPTDALASIEEIKQLKAQYCYCVDNKDWPRWASLFTPDARVDESGFAVARDPITNERVPVEGFSFEFLDELAAFDWPLVGRDAIQSFGETSPSTTAPFTTSSCRRSS